MKLNQRPSLFLFLFLSGCQLTDQTLTLPNSIVTSTPSSVTATATPSVLPFSVTGISPSSTGTSILKAVTITGTGFDSGSTVSIGGTPCLAVTVDSSTQIRCYIQIANWGTYSVIVTNSQNEVSQPLVKGFTVIAPAPVISASLSVTEGPSSGGTHIVVVGSHFQSGSTLTLGGFTCLSPTVTVPYQIDCFTPPHRPETVDIVVTNPDGQSATATSSFRYLSPYIAPSNLVYSLNPAILVLPTSTPVPAPISTPTFSGSLATGYTISPTLPTGFSFDTSTGFVSGSPTVASQTRNYLVTVTNPAGSTTATLSMGVVDLGFGTSDLTPSASSTVLNSYAKVTDASIAVNATSVNVSDPTKFTAGKRILIIQTQDKNKTSFNWEIARISSSWTGNNPVTLSSGLTKSYTSNNTGIITQAVTFPEYNNVTLAAGKTLTASSWDETTGTGGILAFEAKGTVTLNGTLDVSGLGFTGGVAQALGSAGKNGESITGLEAAAIDGAGQGGAVGTTDEFNASGGGGGYGTAGSTGLGYELQSSVEKWAPSYTSGNPNGGGGSSIGITDLSKMFLGPGGGSGASTTGATCTPQDGKKGGGIILIYANNLIVGSTGAIYANGASVTASSGASDSGKCTSGAGAGGSIYLKAISMQLGMNQVQATGGTRTSISSHTQGGAGGDGRIRLDYSTLTGSTVPAASYNSKP